MTVPARDALAEASVIRSFIYSMWGHAGDERVRPVLAALEGLSTRVANLVKERDEVYAVNAASANDRARVAEDALAALRAGSGDPTEGLPPDLLAVLRDPTIRIPQDDVKMADGRSLWDHLEEWRNAPSNTMSAMRAGSGDSEVVRLRGALSLANEAMADGQRRLDTLRDALEGVAEFLSTVTEWTGSDEEELQEEQDAIARALAVSSREPQDGGR